MLASWADSPGRLAHDPRFQDNALISGGQPGIARAAWGATAGVSVKPDCDTAATAELTMRSGGITCGVEVLWKGILRLARREGLEPPTF